MKFSATRGKSAGIQSGAAIVGAVAAHALTQKGSEMLLESSPDSAIAKHLPALVVGACLAVQALGIVPANNDMINSAILGATVTSGMSALREYSGANDPAKQATTGSLANLVSQYVPSLNGLGNAPTFNYQEAAQVALMAGQASAAPLQLSQGAASWAPVRPVAAPVAVKSVGSFSA